MTQREFNHLLSSLDELSPMQRERLLRQLKHKLAAANNQTRNGGETAFDVFSRAGLIGCIKGSPRSPTDLSTNPKHMEGFGLE
jgi:hypothetical protein